MGIVYEIQSLKGKRQKDRSVDLSLRMKSYSLSVQWYLWREVFLEMHWQINRVIRHETFGRKNGP